jgi:hypothetical protein
LEGWNLNCYLNIKYSVLIWLQALGEAIIYREVDVDDIYRLAGFARRISHADMSIIGHYVKGLTINLPSPWQFPTDNHRGTPDILQILHLCTKLSYLESSSPPLTMPKLCAISTHMKELHTYLNIDSGEIFEHMAQLLPSLEKLYIHVEGDEPSMTQMTPLIHPGVRCLEWTHCDSHRDIQAFKLLAGFRIAPRCNVTLRIDDASDADITALLPFFIHNTFDEIHVSVEAVSLLPLAAYLTRAYRLTLRGMIPVPEFFEGHRMPQTTELICTREKNDGDVWTLLDSMANRRVQVQPAVSMFIGLHSDGGSVADGALRVWEYKFKLAPYTARLRPLGIIMTDLWVPGWTSV